ncbi:MAG: T9SS type A sorting domain-containing protein [Bacteroidota bacterium]
MKTIYLLFFLLTFTGVVAQQQTLDISPRPAGALTGSQVITMLTPLSLTIREDSIYAQIIKGNVPDFLRILVPVYDTVNISGSNTIIKYFVIPDYMALGCDTNYFYCPMTPLLAQRVADYLGCTLPTRKMVNDIWTYATVKLRPQPIPPSGQMITVPVFAAHNDSVHALRDPLIPTHPLGELTGGDKKDVIISNEIYGHPAPGRVVIYGWHYLSGTPIQPLYYGHEETYADYSHGIRMVQNEILVNGSLTTVQDVLTSSTLNTLLSDEGAIAVPRYPVTAPDIPLPKSFAVINTSNTSIQLLTHPDSRVAKTKISISRNGLVFPLPTRYTSFSPQINSLSSDSIYYLKIALGGTNGGVSIYSEVLASVPGSTLHPILIVNSFDRATTGNTHDFIRQHGQAVFNNGYGFCSVTNEALTDSLLLLSSFPAADYIFGEESTMDSTLTPSEQKLIEVFLNQGGRLLASGAELAWDLDFKGTATDSVFYHSFLKAKYVYDAPNNVSSTFYRACPAGLSIFSGIDTVSFDNGTQGTYNVRYPDVISPLGGAQECLYYSGFPTQSAGIQFEGFLPAGTATMRLVNLGIPFETFYPSGMRDTLMSRILDFFFPNTTTTENFFSKNNVLKTFPNPCHGQLFAELPLKDPAEITFSLYNLQGQNVFLYKTEMMNVGVARLSIPLNGLTPGLYILRAAWNGNEAFSKVVIN